MYFIILFLMLWQIECVGTTTSQHLIATSTLNGNVVVWDVETHLKVCYHYQVIIASLVCLQFCVV